MARISRLRTAASTLSTPVSSTSLSNSLSRPSRCLRQHAASARRQHLEPPMASFGQTSAWRSFSTSRKVLRQEIGDVDSPTYIPAETGEGLEEIGSGQGQWRGFFDLSVPSDHPEEILYGRPEKLTDPVALEEAVKNAFFSVMGRHTEVSAPAESEWQDFSFAENLPVKFEIAREVQRHTGHIIPDHKLFIIDDAKAMLAHLVKPPKPKKVIEVIEAKGELKVLPNVQVYPRRVTPIDKEKMVGRWKVIVQELEKRELPVTGTGGYAKTVEKKWATGKA